MASTFKLGVLAILMGVTPKTALAGCPFLSGRELGQEEVSHAQAGITRQMSVFELVRLLYAYLRKITGTYIFRSPPDHW